MTNKRANTGGSKTPTQSDEKVNSGEVLAIRGALADVRAVAAQMDGAAWSEGRDVLLDAAARIGALVRVRSVERAERSAAKRGAANEQPVEASYLGSFCPECGWHVRVDEDGLCASCGATCTGRAVDEEIRRRTEERTRAAFDRLVESARP